MLTTTQEKPLIKLEIDDYTIIPNDVYENKTSTDLKEIEFEMITPIDFSDKRKVEIYNGIAEVDERLAVINQKVEELNTEIDRLTNHADGLDYTIAVASGIIAGAIDIFYVGEFSLDRGKEWSNEKVNNFVMDIAKKNGFDPEAYEGKNPLKGAIKFLEDKYHIPSDGVWNSDHYGINGISHHLDDWAHHPSLLGLIFSIITQFTQTGYFTNKYGENIKIDVPISLQRKKNGNTETIILIGNDIPSKFFCGVINWAMHLVSDMAGSSDNAGAGMGIPGPIMALLKEFSAIPGINKTSLPKTIGDFFEKNRFDLRSELAVGHEIGRQAIPVVVNEALVRGFYFLRRLIQQLKEKESFKDIEWKKTLPFKNRTIVRMLTIATGTFTAIDLADAGIRAVIKSGGFNPATLGNFILRVNFVGVGRFAIAVSTDVAMGIKKSKKENERIRLRGEELQLLNAKVFYKEADMWIAAENTDKAIEEVYIIMERTAENFVDTWNEIKEGSVKRREYIDKIKAKDDHFAKELSDLIEWE
ncbi:MULTISPECIES: hypothetical protein [unclassified Clostridium]|uniref:hypothetical protein n=1 Tax=unclassified Clostridium TaxID=2614128 RepID=UPI000297DEE8|nr:MULTISPECIES: hypothetical protein [unclassified Clostridium]EKQ56197.1 MAG: hypothetical protein A370_02174 [Clostridium sp. Maddingley MBC34-26]